MAMAMAMAMVEQYRGFELEKEEMKK